MTQAEKHPLLELLSAYLDGELAAGEWPAVEQHLDGCAGCRDRLEDLRLLARVTADEEAPPVPGGLAARVVQRLDEELATATPSAGMRRHRPPWLWRGGPLAAAASLFAAAILWRLWLSAPAPLAPLKTVVEPSAPEVQEIAPAGEQALPSSSPGPAPPPAKKKEKAKGAGHELKEEEPARKDDLSRGAVLGFASEDAAAPEDEMRVDDDARGMDSPAANAAARAMVPGQLQESRRMEPAVMREDDAEEGALLQEEKDGIHVTLSRDGTLQIRAAGYRCQLDLDMENGAVWSQAGEAASRGVLGQMVVRRYRAELEEQCGLLPEALAMLPQN